MKYARIIDNKVIEIFIPPIGFGIEECFHEDIASQFIECSEEVEQNWIYDNKAKTFSAPVVDTE